MCPAMVCQLPDDEDIDDDDNSHVAVQGALTSCCSLGQLVIFLIYCYSSTKPSLLCLLVLLPLAVFAFLAAEIYLRLANEDDGTPWSGGRGRRRYVTVRMDDERTTWLPHYDPSASPHKDRIRPLFDDGSTRSPQYVAHHQSY